MPVKKISSEVLTHTYPFNGPLSGTTRVSRYKKGKTNLDFTKARDSEWQWHQLGILQVCISLQTDNHASTPPLFFYRPDALPAAQPTVSKHWRLTVKQVKKYKLQHTNAFVSYNRKNECLFGCKPSRTTCSVREDKRCPTSLSKSSFARSNSSVGTQKGLGPWAEPLVMRSGGSGCDGPLKLWKLSLSYQATIVQWKGKFATFGEFCSQ